jgi:hypothetical protein
VENLDPEEARAIINAPHHYDGYVVQSIGDGIFALFGRLHTRIIRNGKASGLKPGSSFGLRTHWCQCDRESELKMDIAAGPNWSLPTREEPGA